MSGTINYRINDLVREYLKATNQEANIDGIKPFIEDGEQHFDVTICDLGSGSGRGNLYISLTEILVFMHFSKA